MKINGQRLVAVTLSLVYIALQIQCYGVTENSTQKAIVLCLNSAILAVAVLLLLVPKEPPRG